MPPTFSFQYTSTVKILFHSSDKNKQKSPINDSVSLRIKAKGHVMTYKLLKMSLPFNLSTYCRIPFHSLLLLPNTPPPFTCLNSSHIPLLNSSLLSHTGFLTVRPSLMPGSFHLYLSTRLFTNSFFPLLKYPFLRQAYHMYFIRIRLLTPLSIRITVIDFSLQCLPPSNTLCTCVFNISIVFPLS